MPSINLMLKCATGLLATAPHSDHAIQPVSGMGVRSGDQQPLSDQVMHPAHDTAPNMDINIAPTISTDMVPDDPTSMDITANKRSITAVSSGCGRLDAFGIGTDSAIWTRHWTETSNKTAWISLGGETRFPPAAVSPKPGHLEVFHVGVDGHAYSNSFDGSSWLGWEDRVGFFTSSLVATSWGPHHVDFFGLGYEKGIWHKSYDRSTGWGTYTNLGPYFASEPAAVSWGPGRIDVFGVGGDAAMYWRVFADGTWSSGYESLGGDFKSPPTVVSPGPGRLNLFAIDSSSGALRHRQFANGSWSAEWENVGGVGLSAVSAVTSSFFGTDRIDVFLVGGSNTMYHRALSGATWTPWTSHGQAFSSAPAVASWYANRLDILGVGAGDKAAWHQAWNGSDWTPSIKGWGSEKGVFKVFP